MKRIVSSVSRGLLLPAISALLLSACGGGSKEVSFLSLASRGSASYKIAKSKSDQRFLLIPFSADSYDEGVEPSGSVPFTVDFTKVTAASKITDIQTDRQSVLKISPEFKESWLESKRKRIEFEDKRDRETRGMLEGFKDYIKTLPAGSAKALYKKGFDPSRKMGRAFALDLPASLTVEYEVDCDPLPCVSKKLTGNLRVQGTASAIYVDVDDAGDVSDTVAQSLINMFDNVTLKRARAFWGDETDINDDGAVIVMLSSKLGSGIVGFFRPLDLLPQSYLDTHGYSDYDSNEMEIIFSALPGGSFYKELIDATLAHEFFHLINMGVKTLGPLLENGTLTQESLFLNEGMAHLSEDITGHGFDAFVTAGYFLEKFHLASVAGSVDPSIQIGLGDDCLERRGATMLFLRYLFERKGGARYSSETAGSVSGDGLTFLKSLNSSAYTGVHNIEKTYGDNMEDLFKAWLAAVALDGTGLSSDKRYNYDPEENDGFTDQKRGFDLKGTRTLPNDEVVTLSGPVLAGSLSTDAGPADISESVFSTGGMIYGLDVKAGNTLSFTMSGSAGVGLGMTIVRLQ